MAAVKKKATTKKASTSKIISPEERWHMVSVAAYYRAEKQGFVGSDPGRDWMEAEKEIDAMLKKQKTKVK